jgi:DNA polymerase I-like protein with 3'-5' exonuclease and polymerase domains
MIQLRLFEEHIPRDEAALRRCLNARAIAIDIETDTRWSGQGPKQEYGLSYPAPITVIAFAWRTEEGLETTSIAAPFDAVVIDLLHQLFEKTIIAHNAVFDLRQLSKLTGGKLPENIWDTMVMARLLHPEPEVSYSLLGVAGMLHIPVPERQRQMKRERRELHKQSLEITMEYAEDDVRLTYAIYERQRQLPAESELIEWECRAMYEYCRMAAEGIRLNLPYIDQYLTELQRERDGAALRLMHDGLTSPGSPKARVKYLYQQKGIPLPKWDPDSVYFTRTGRRRLRKSETPEVMLDDLSTSAGVIESYIDSNPLYAPLLQDLSAYMSTDWLISTVEGLVDHAVIDGRVHSLVTVATESGRRASSHPHMQNWKMPQMAGVATGDEGFTLVEIDYSNAENVMAALISSDNNLAAACATEDFHSTMAVQYFGELWQEGDSGERKRLREMSKKLTYGTAYGMGAKRLSESMGVSLNEGYAFLKAKDRAFSSVARTRRIAEARVREEGRLTLWTGRPVPVVHPFVAWNYLCQGGVSEMLKRAIVRVSESYRAQGMRSRVALDMHDALILEVAHEEWDDAVRLASDIMAHIVPAELTERTTPPIRWKAQPKPEENKKKWGALQWHPA